MFIDLCDSFMKLCQYQQSAQLYRIHTSLNEAWSIDVATKTFLYSILKYFLVFKMELDSLRKQVWRL